MCLLQFLKSFKESSKTIPQNFRISEVNLTKTSKVLCISQPPIFLNISKTLHSNSKENKARDTLETLGAQVTPRTAKELQGF